MSLLKAYQLNTTKLPSYAESEKDFKLAVDACFLAIDSVQKEDVVHLIKAYAEYSVRFLAEVAVTLEEPKGASQKMKYMNSFIASLTHVANLHYFDSEQGYSVIDKAVQKALDNGGTIAYPEVLTIIQELEDSYKEPEI